MLSKFARSLVLMLAMAGMSGTVLSVSSIAQEKAKDTKKDDTKKDTKKDAKDAKDSKDDSKKDTKKAAVAKASTVKIGEGNDGKFRFSIYDADDKFLAMSGANTFESKADAVKGLQELKDALKETKIEYLESKKVKDKEKEKVKDKEKEKVKDKDK